MVATGGGAVLREANRRALREGGKVVYLRSSPEELYRRLRHDTQRPLLQVEDPGAPAHHARGARPAVPRDAHFQIETGRPSVPTLVNMILMQLELAGPDSPAPLNSGACQPRIPPRPFQQVRIALGERSYPIQIGAGLLATLPTWEGLPAAAAALIVTNTTGRPLYAAQAARHTGATLPRRLRWCCPTARSTRTGRRST